MKTLKVIFLLASAFLHWQCDKNEDPVLKHGDIIQLKNTQKFIHNFHISGDEEGATITVQAKHFSESKLSRDESTNWSVVYSYQSESGFVGKDSVEIETCTGGEGVTCTNHETVKFIFEVSE